LRFCGNFAKHKKTAKSSEPSHSAMFGLIPPSSVCAIYFTNSHLIGDLYKTEVYRLSQYINDRAGREMIPADIISKEPSAELAPDQKDTDSLPPYEVLDEILKYVIEGKQLSKPEYQRVKSYVDQLNETNRGLVDKIVKMIARNEYKRFQAPLIIRIRARAFGNGRQMPIAAKY
jgi:NAD+ synthase (glutamine-hydrolysing)